LAQSGHGSEATECLLLTQSGHSSHLQISQTPKADAVLGAFHFLGLPAYFLN
jgi:hypothetical protein